MRIILLLFIMFSLMTVTVISVSNRETFNVQMVQEVEYLINDFEWSRQGDKINLCWKSDTECIHMKAKFYYYGNGQFYSASLSRRQVGRARVRMPTGARAHAKGHSVPFRGIRVPFRDEMGARRARPFG